METRGWLRPNRDHSRNACTRLYAGFDLDPLYTELPVYNPRWPHTPEEHTFAHGRYGVGMWFVAFFFISFNFLVRKTPSYRDSTSLPNV